MTDNGAAYKSFAFRDALLAHDVQHKRTRPYAPRTKGKAERFIQSSIREWAYAQPFQSSAERAKVMHPWLHDYNTALPHAAFGGKPLIGRLNRDNLNGSDIYADQDRQIPAILCSQNTWLPAGHQRVGGLAGITKSIEKLAKASQPPTTGNSLGA